MFDIHQHLWGAELIDELRRRRDVPRLRGWTLETADEPPYEVSPHHHDVELPGRRPSDDRGTQLAAVSLSSPLGIESHPDGSALLAAYHLDALELPAPFRAWASVSASTPTWPD